MRRLSLILAAFAFSAKALAGGWTSGGGELLESSINPWFILPGGVQTHRVVKWCVVVDEANFGVDEATLTDLVGTVFQRWQADFRGAVIPDNGHGNRVNVATESFFPDLQGCKDDTPIRFQFGVLSDRQLQEFKDRAQDPAKLIAVAVRTDYDEERLEGKGFVYVSPPRGPLAMKGRDVVDDPWKSQNHLRLLAVLRHELGHVFGLQHSGTDKDLMGAGFPEQAVSGTQWYFAAWRSMFTVPLGIDLERFCVGENGTFPADLARFFGVPAGHRCVAARLWRDRLEITSRVDANAPPFVLGVAPFDAGGVRRTEPLVRLWLPTAQKVFKNIPAFFGNTLIGPTAERSQRTATYTISATRETREISVQIAPESVQLDGVVDGKLRLNLIPTFAP